MWPRNEKFGKFLKKSVCGLSRHTHPRRFRVLSVVFLWHICITSFNYARNPTPSCSMALQHQPNPHHISISALLNIFTLLHVPCLLHHRRMHTPKPLPGQHYNRNTHYTFNTDTMPSRNPHHARHLQTLQKLLQIFTFD